MTKKACRLPSKYDIYQVGQGGRYDRVGWVVYEKGAKNLADRVYQTRQAACLAAGRLNRMDDRMRRR